jgi:hypothetical protein
LGLLVVWQKKSAFFLFSYGLFLGALLYREIAETCQEKALNRGYTVLF